jgi:hypothetical protein
MHLRLGNALLVACAAGLAAQGCNGVLEVTDPDVLPEPNSAAGAVALYNGAILRLTRAVDGGDPAWNGVFLLSGMLADEWRSLDVGASLDAVDRRGLDPVTEFARGTFGALHRARTESQIAIAALRRFLPVRTGNPDSTFMVGRMFAHRAYVLVLLGEDYCNGVPLSELQGADIVYGQPLSDDSLFALAAALADSARANVRGSDSARIRSLAQVVEARALLDRGQFAAAAAMVPSAGSLAVATTFHYDVTYSHGIVENETYFFNSGLKKYTMVDREGGVGLDYITANDPRLPRAESSDPGFDSSVPVYETYQGLWGAVSSIAIATGVEARLIEAEAALRAGDVATWLGIINGLRTDAALYPVPQPGFTSGPTLTALADPGTQAAREDAMFRERAFWLFGTGHRLGDMRRLVSPRQYGRPAEQVYPSGTYFKGGSYGDALMLPVPQDEQNNPNFSGCLDTNP